VVWGLLGSSSAWKMLLLGIRPGELSVAVQAASPTSSLIQLNKHSDHCNPVRAERVNGITNFDQEPEGAKCF